MDITWNCIMRYMYSASSLQPYSGFQLTLAAAVGKSLGNLGGTLQNSQLRHQIW